MFKFLKSKHSVCWGSTFARSHTCSCACTRGSGGKARPWRPCNWIQVPILYNCLLKYYSPSHRVNTQLSFTVVPFWKVSYKKKVVFFFFLKTEPACSAIWCIYWILFIYCLFNSSWDFRHQDQFIKRLPVFLWSLFYSERVLSINYGLREMFMLCVDIEYYFHSPWMILTSKRVFQV